MNEPADFDEVYAASARRLVRQVYALTTDVGDAQDIVQEAFTRAFLRWRRVSRSDDPEAWVRTVAFRLAVSRWRHVRMASSVLRRQPPPTLGPELSPDHVALVAALRQIPDAQRQAVVLHHLVGRSVDEIASDLGVPAGTVKARLSRGRAALAPLLSDVAEGAGHG